MRLLAVAYLLIAFSFSSAAQQARFIGAGGCSGSNCHGGTAAANDRTTEFRETSMRSGR